jgi:hypothetical protein
VGCQREADLPTLHGGRPDRAHAAAPPARGPATARAPDPGERAEPALGHGLRLPAPHRRAWVPRADRARPVHPRVPAPRGGHRAHRSEGRGRARAARAGPAARRRRSRWTTGRSSRAAPWRPRPTSTRSSSTSSVPARRSRTPASRPSTGASGTSVGMSNSSSPGRMPGRSSNAGGTITITTVRTRGYRIAPPPRWRLRGPAPPSSTDPASPLQTHAAWLRYSLEDQQLANCPRTRAQRNHGGRKLNFRLDQFGGATQRVHCYFPTGPIPGGQVTLNVVGLGCSQREESREATSPSTRGEGSVSRVTDYGDGSVRIPGRSGHTIGN